MYLYDRVQFADNTQGLIMSIKTDHGVTAFLVLIDDYIQITCDPDQVGVINRRDIAMLNLESHHSGGKVYRLFTSEINMLARYSMAVWHDYWGKHPMIGGRLPMGAAKYPIYWDIYQAGNIEQLPEERDIRRSEAIRPTQESMGIGEVKHGR